MTQDVDPAAIKTAGDAYGRVAAAAAAAVNQLAGVLKGTAGMAGTDNGAHAWASKYDPLCGGRAGTSGVMEAASTAVIAAGQCADLLHATAVNHSNADVRSAVNSPNAPAVLPGAVPTFRVPAIPSAEGGHGDVPAWWHSVQAYVQGELWPNGHQDQLHKTATAWRACGASLRAAAFAANSSKPYVQAQKSPEIPAVVTNLTHTADAMYSAADGCDVAAAMCDSYATEIDTAHSAILEAMTELAATIAVTEIVAAVLIPVTLGASEAVSKVVDVSRLSATGVRIAEICRTFRAAAEASALPSVAAAGAAVRTVRELAPLLEARAMLFAAEGTGAIDATSPWGLDLLRRPDLRPATKRAIEAAAEKTPDGKYFVSATDDMVYIPVSKQYDQEILNLPKTADGKYYQGADGIRYPVNPVYQYGHVPNEEWWRIRDRAITEHWTRQQQIDYYNNPSIYRIEDAPGNEGHKFELPREKP